jgi:hypothetical protein
MGRRTSVYLSDELAVAVAASGVPLAELVRRGLGMVPAEPPVTVGPVQVVADERVPAGAAVLVSDGRVAGALDVRPPSRRPASRVEGQCPPHPGGRVLKGLCGACGTFVGSRG